MKILKEKKRNTHRKNIKENQSKINNNINN